LPEAEPGTPDASPDSAESGTGADIIMPDQEPKGSGTDVVVDELLERGWRYYQQGDHDRALAVAERAQGIAPRHPESYLLMASSQLALYRNGVAEQLARRGLSLSRAGTEVNRRLQALLAEITAMR
jgi:Tfp pilus assembly protein PilF